jgi:hypothetical protein
LGRISPVVGFFERVFRGVLFTKLARVVQISNFQRSMKGSLWGRGEERLEKVGTTRKEKKEKLQLSNTFFFFDLLFWMALRIRAGARALALCEFRSSENIISLIVGAARR